MKRQFHGKLSFHLDLEGMQAADSVTASDDAFPPGEGVPGKCLHKIPDDSFRQCRNHSGGTAVLQRDAADGSPQIRRVPLSEKAGTDAQSVRHSAHSQTVQTVQQNIQRQRF